MDWIGWAEKEGKGRRWGLWGDTWLFGEVGEFSVDEGESKFRTQGRWLLLQFAIIIS